MSTPKFLDPGRPRSLWTKIVALIALLLLGGTLFTGTASLALLQRTLTASLDAELRSGVTTLISSAGSEPMSLSDEETQALLGLSPVNFQIVVRDADGNPISVARKSGDQSDPTFLALPPETRPEVLARDGDPYTLLDNSGQPWRVLSVATPRLTGPTVTLGLPMSSVQQTMNQMATIVLLIGSIVVVAGSATGGYFVHRALASLRGVEATASRIADGDLSQRVPVSTSSHEVRQLAVALNEMLAQIEISFQKQLDSEERATSSEQRMRRFVADASHELRTPLAAIRGFGELYRMGALRREEDVASALRRIEDEAQRMGSLVESLLRLARMEENPDLELEPVDLTDPVFDAAQDLRAIDPERTVMVCDLGGVPLPVDPHVPVGVLGHEPSLRQVLLNLVGNASRHTPKDSPVELALGTAHDGMVRLEVRDHGSGIPFAQREKIFERFYRTDESRQRSAGGAGGGAGLGLAIAARIIASHRGRIEVVETPGGGATFRVSLQPAATDGLEATPPDQVVPIGQGSDGGS